MRIAIDIDSTLHHYWDQLATAAQRRFGIELPYESQLTWSIPLLRKEQLVACIKETHSEPAILAAEPYPGAVETVTRWHEAGHFIQITSHRSETAHEPTLRWLAQIALPYDELHCSYDKVQRCRELEIDLLIDDSPVNISHAQDAGILTATISHPWNRDLCEEEAVLCADDWFGLSKLIDPVLARGRPLSDLAR
jgi:uncharacterized HAD superfamily protein